MSQRGLDIRVLGDLSRAPVAVQQAAADIEAASQRLPHTVGRLNIMFSYTATYELCRVLASAHSSTPLLRCNGCHVAEHAVTAAEHVKPAAASERPEAYQLNRLCGCKAEHVRRQPAQMCPCSCEPPEPCATCRLRLRHVPLASALPVAQDTQCPQNGCAAGAAVQHRSATPPNGINSQLNGRTSVQCASCSCASSNGKCLPRGAVWDGVWAGTDKLLLTSDSPPVDLLIRTSGESRLSDFMVWQCRSAQLAWVPELWPALRFSTFARCVRSWQRAGPELESLREVVESAGQL